MEERIEAGNKTFLKVLSKYREMSALLMWRGRECKALIEGWSWYLWYLVLIVNSRDRNKCSYSSELDR